MDDERIRITCGGCESDLPVPPHQSVEELVADVEACAPFCIVCAGRSVFGARPAGSVWQEIDLELEATELTMGA